MHLNNLFDESIIKEGKAEPGPIKKAVKSVGSKALKIIPWVAAGAAGTEAYQKYKEGDLRGALRLGMAALAYTNPVTTPVGVALDFADPGEVGKFYHDISANGVNPAFESVTEQFENWADEITATVLESVVTEAQFDEAAGEKDACYHKVKSRYKVWPSAYASGALVQCRKKGAANWGNSKKK